jgi:hypothetical protein
MTAKLGKFAHEPINIGTDEIKAVSGTEIERISDFINQ